MLRSLSFHEYYILHYKVYKNLTSEASKSISFIFALRKCYFSYLQFFKKAIFETTIFFVNAIFQNDAWIGYSADTGMGMGGM